MYDEIIHEKGDLEEPEKPIWDRDWCIWILT